MRTRGGGHRPRRFACTIARVIGREGEPNRAAEPRLAPALGIDDEARAAKARVAEALFGGAPDEPTADAVPYAKVDRYELDSRLGAGSMGVVYQAWDPQLERPVAIKVLHNDVAAEAKARQRLVREAKSLARLSHPNVIQVYDVGTDGDRVFVAMELVDGETLGQWLRRAPRTWRETAAIMTDAGRGVAAAHRAGLVHRDLKPDNILIGRDGRVRVLDFGLARVNAPAPDAADQPHARERSGPHRRSGGPSAPATTLTETGTVVGTPLYMAPEQLLDGRSATAVSDQFSFCVTFYEALYGRRPFDGSTLPSIVANMSQGNVCEPAADHAVPRRVFELIQRGLAKDPEQRWPGLDAFLSELGEVMRMQVAGGSRSRVAWWVVAGLVLVVGLVAVWMVR